MKKLYRARNERIIAGVCGGLGQYFDLDPTVIRLIWGVALLATGCFPMLIGYILAWAIIPEEPVAGETIDV